MEKKKDFGFFISGLIWSAALIVFAGYMIHPALFVALPLVWKRMAMNYGAKNPGRY